MKVIDVLELMEEYDRVRVYPQCDLEWNDENPYFMDAREIRDLGWLFVQKVSHRIVVRLTSDTVEGGDSCLTVVYR